MKVLLTLYERVALSTGTVPSFELDAMMRCPPGSIDMGIREIQLQPRDLNGITCFVAYDQESDTLFIKQERINWTPACEDNSDAPPP